MATSSRSSLRPGTAPIHGQSSGISLLAGVVRAAHQAVAIVALKFTQRLVRRPPIREFREIAASGVAPTVRSPQRKASASLRISKETPRVADGDTAMNETRRYENQGSPAEITYFPEGQYLQIERHGDQVSILWSSNKPLKDVLRDLIDEYEESHGRFDGDIEWDRLDSYRSPTLQSVADFIDESDSGAVSYAQVAFESFTFTWTRVPMKSDAAAHRYAELSLTYKSPNQADLLEYVEHTATPEVRDNASRVLGRSAIVSL